MFKMYRNQNILDNDFNVSLNIKEKLIWKSCGTHHKTGPPGWRRGRGLDCGSGDPCSISGIPSPHVGPRMARRLNGVFGRPGARNGVGLARLVTLVAHGVWCTAVGKNLETGQLFRHYIAEILLNVTLNHIQPTNTHKTVIGGSSLGIYCISFEKSHRRVTCKRENCYSGKKCITAIEIVTTVVNGSLKLTILLIDKRKSR